MFRDPSQVMLATYNTETKVVTTLSTPEPFMGVFSVIGTQVYLIVPERVYFKFVVYRGSLSTDRLLYTSPGILATAYGRVSGGIIKGYIAGESLIESNYAQIIQLVEEVETPVVLSYAVSDVASELDDFNLYMLFVNIPQIPLLEVTANDI